MATIQNRGDLQWRAIIRRKGYPTQTKTFSYQADAIAWSRKVEREMDTGTWRDTTDADSTTVAEALDLYLKTVSVHKKGKGYITDKYRAAGIKRHKLAKASLSRLRGMDVAEYRDERLKSVGANTVRLDLALLSHLYTVARSEWGMESLQNPIKAVRKPTLRGTERDRRLRPGEEAKLLQAAQESGQWWLGPVILFALETAARRGEIANLEWTDVDLEKRQATLRDTKNGTRTAISNRTIPLSSRAIKILEQIPRTVRGPVFGVLADRITKGFAKAAADAGIEDIRFHDLRHEATSRLFERGLSPMQVKTITGHKTLQMLARYTHLHTEDLTALLG